MQRLVISMFVVVMFVLYLVSGDRLGRAAILPGAVSLLPEVLSAMALIAVVALGVRDGFRRVRAAYWLVFGSFLLVIAGGAVVNHVEVGPIVSGLRLYLRGMPWFFVPAVFAFSAEQLRSQLRWLLGLCLLQLPLAVEQRIRTSENVMGFSAVTGDWTTGTMGDSGILSIVLIAAACVLAGLYSRQQLRTPHFLLLLLLLLFPTTINETKVTIVLVPLGLMAALITAAPRGMKLRRALTALLLLLAFGAIFVPVYDSLVRGRQYDDGRSVLEFFTDRDALQSYLSSESTVAGAVRLPGRVEAVAIPLQRLADDPVKLAFGYGIGNASESSLGPAYSGRYGLQYHDYMQSAAARVVLELGVGGVIFLVVIYWLILSDSLKVARGPADSLSGIAAGWTGVIAVMVPSMAYALLDSFPPVVYLFWYFSGLVAAERMRRQ